MGTYKLVVYRFVDLTDYKTTKQQPTPNWLI